TIANVETGRQNVPRDFWERADQAVNAGGALLAAADQLEALVQRQREETAQLADIKREREQHRPGLRQVAELASSPEQVGVLLDHLRDQWHLLVKTDNLLGPRHAARGVLDQLAVIEELLRVTRDATRREVAKLAAQYAESAAWLHEDAGDLPRARFWTSRAMEWAQESQDPFMSMWTLFRSSQRALSEGDAGQAIELARPATLGANGQLAAIAEASRDSGDASDVRHPVERRSFLAASGVATFGSAPRRVLQALDIVTSDHADTLSAAHDCLNELISHYSEKLSVSPPADTYDDLLNIRSYAGTLLQRATRSPTQHRSDIVVAAGWLSNLLAVAASYLGDQESALIWCVDAERRSHESGHPDIAGWAALNR